MNDPYFQKLFAERIGGADYGKGTAIYKFEKIKRAKRQALADHPGLGAQARMHIFKCHVFTQRHRQIHGRHRGHRHTNRCRLNAACDVW